MKKDQSKRILTYFNLLTQMRVRGGNDYISYARALLSGTVKEKKKFSNYDLKIVTDFKKFNQIMYRKDFQGYRRKGAAALRDLIKLHQDVEMRLKK